jgi:hypothetical protein
MKNVKHEETYENVYYSDINGRTHKKYRVRSMGPGSGYMVVEILYDYKRAVDVDFATREDAHEWMRVNEPTPF